MGRSARKRCRTRAKRPRLEKGQEEQEERDGQDLEPSRTLMRLPDELYRVIFVFCLDEWPLPSIHHAPLALQRVCRGWRYIAHNTPRLWSRLYLRNVSGASGVLAVHERIASKWLSLTKSVPFSLRIEQRQFPTAISNDDATFSVGRDGSIFFELVRRCKVLDVTLCSVNQHYLRRILTTAFDASDLQELSVEMKSPTGRFINSALEAQLAPLSIGNEVVQRLRVLNVLGAVSGQTVVVDTLRSSCSNLRRVALEKRMHWDEFVQCLVLCPRLEDANFRIFTNSTPNDGHMLEAGAPTAYETHIRRLSLNLDIRSATDASALTLLTLPSMECLTMEFHGISFEAPYNVNLRQIAAMLLESSANLSHLCMLNTALLHPEETYEFLLRAPQIETLTLSSSHRNFEKILMWLTIQPPASSPPPAQRHCPQLECLELSSCCWGRGSLVRLSNMIASRHGLRSSFRMEDRRAREVRVEEFELDEGVRPVGRVMVGKHRVRCRSCHKDGVYDPHGFTQLLRKYKAIKGCIEKGLKIESVKTTKTNRSSLLRH